VDRKAINAQLDQRAATLATTKPFQSEAAKRTLEMAVKVTKEIIHALTSTEMLMIWQRVSELKPYKEKYAHGKKSWAFWSGKPSAELAKKHAEVSLEKSALGGLFDNININGSWDIQMWASLSKAYATHVEFLRRYGGALLVRDDDGLLLSSFGFSHDLSRHWYPYHQGAGRPGRRRWPHLLRHERSHRKGPGDLCSGLWIRSDTGASLGNLQIRQRH
jgi:hypothetical protein